jgi:hypothetical protein
MSARWSWLVVLVCCSTSSGSASDAGPSNDGAPSDAFVEAGVFEADFPETQAPEFEAGLFCIPSGSTCSGQSTPCCGATSVCPPSGLCP